MTFATGQGNRCQDCRRSWVSCPDSQPAVDNPQVVAYSHTPTRNTECG